MQFSLVVSFATGLVTSFLWASSTSAPLAAEPIVPQASNCDCMPVFAPGYYGCPDDAGSVVTITPLATGTCFALLGFCFDADPCRWEYSMYYKTSTPPADLRVYFNGMQRLQITGEALDIGPLAQQLDCTGTASVAVGSNGNICIEALFECEDCPANH